MLSEKAYKHMKASTQFYVKCYEIRQENKFPVLICVNIGYFITYNENSHFFNSRLIDRLLSR